MDTLEEHLEELAQAAHRADLHFKIWWIFKNERPTYVAVMNEFLGFFRASVSAHFVAMLMELYKLLDPRNDSLSLKSLLAEARSRPDTDAEAVAALGQSLSALDPTWRKVRRLRNKLFAHRDAKLSYDTVLAEAAVTPDDFRNLINQSFGAINEMRAMRSMGTWPRDNLTGRDTQRLLDALVALIETKPTDPKAQSHEPSGDR